MAVAVNKQAVQYLVSLAAAPVRSPLAAPIPSTNSANNMNQQQQQFCTLTSSAK
jgi:hypothetical protein